MSITVAFPEELLVACGQDRDQFVHYVTIYTLGHLYEQNKISSGLGARVLECGRREFYRLLEEYGFSIIDYPLTDQDDELQTSYEMADRIEPRRAPSPKQSSGCGDSP